MDQRTKFVKSGIWTDHAVDSLWKSTVIIDVRRKQNKLLTPAQKSSSLSLIPQHNLSAMLLQWP